MKHLIKYLFISTILVLSFQLTTFSQMQFEANLTGEQQVPSVSTEASGTAVFNMTNEGLEYLITVNNISITAAHIHKGAIGAEGAVVKTLTADFEGNTASGVWASTDSEPLTETMVEALLKGDLYLNVHTEDYPDGEIRGQISTSSSTSFTAVLEGSQTVPSVESNTKGTAVFELTSEGLKYDFTINGSSASRAKLFVGSRNTNGELVKTIELNSNSEVGVWTKSDSDPLTNAVIEAMLKGDVYLEIETDSNPEGEVRGQLKLEGGIHLNSALSSDNTESSGTANLTITSAGLVYTAVVDSLDIQSAAFYEGEAEFGGEMLKDISFAVNNNSVVGVWLSSDNSGDLNSENMAAFINGDVYLSINSESDADSKLSGQIEFNAEASLNAKLAVSTESNAELVGIGNFHYTNQGLKYRFTVEGNSTSSINLMTDSGTMVSLDSKVGTNTFAGVWSSSDSNAFVEADFEAMLKGDVWLELSEDTTRNGETKGYVNANADLLLTASLNSDQETDNEPSNAGGTAFIKVVGETVVHFATVDSIDVQAASFNKAEIGAEGSVIQTISADFSNGTAVGVWISNDSELDALLNGNVYLKIGSSENPDGEIRGQAMVKGGLGLYTRTSGENLITPIETDASGTGYFTLTSKGLVYNFSSESIVITDAAIRYGAENEIGPIAISITEDLSSNTSSGVWLSNSLEGFSKSDIVAVLQGETYLKTSSSLSVDGETRGQIKPSDKDNTIVGVDEKNGEDVLPNNLVLKQNYPNPFNPTTTIEFSIPQSTQVSLKIYDLLGREIKTLLSDELQAGVHTVELDASTLASGVYFYQLEAGDLVEVKKMNLLK